MMKSIRFAGLALLAAAAFRLFPACGEDLSFSFEFPASDVTPDASPTSAPNSTTSRPPSDGATSSNGRSWVFRPTPRIIFVPR